MWSTDLSSSIDGLNQQWKGWSIIDMRRRKSRAKSNDMLFVSTDPFWTSGGTEILFSRTKPKLVRDQMLLIHSKIQNTQYTILSIVFVSRHSSRKYCKLVFYQIYLGGAGIHATRQRRTIPTILSSAHSVTDGLQISSQIFHFFRSSIFQTCGRSLHGDMIFILTKSL